jgi:hypothetical protein
MLNFRPFGVRKLKFEVCHTLSVLGMPFHSVGISEFCYGKAFSYFGAALSVVCSEHTRKSHMYRFLDITKTLSL